MGYDGNKSTFKGEYMECKEEHKRSEEVTKGEE